MTKKSFLTLVLAVFLVLMIAACGNDKNKDESENTDTDAAPDEEQSEIDDADDTEAFSDIDMDEIPDDGCTTKSSFGTHSLMRDITDTCVKEIVGHPGGCKWQYNEQRAAKYISEHLRYEMTFIKECEDENEKIIECPDFIPEALKLTKLAGCDVYTIDPYSGCSAPCPDIYFSTDNDIFHTVLVGEIDAYPSSVIYIKSSGEKGVSFEAEFHLGLNNAAFIWSEKAEDGTEIKKKAFLKMRVVDPVTGEGEGEEVDDSDQIPAQCEDYEDRLYTEGDLIPDGCGILICSEEGWIPYGNLGCYDECDPDGVLEIRYWDCPNGEELEWCICEADEEYGSIWSCINRVDLTCPAE